MRHTKICRVCGKEYTPCNGSALRNSDTINWQVVACSKECGAEYFARIAASRSVAVEDTPVANAVEEVAEPVAEVVEQEAVPAPKKRSKASKVSVEVEE